MLLRIRVRLPDRPGSLGKVARILGAAGADVVQMAVLERDSGRALDDFMVAWPAGAGIDRLCEGLASVPGVEVVGIWPTTEPPGINQDAALIGQLAAAREGAGLVIMTDAVPAMLSADWAGLVRMELEAEEVVGGVLVHTSLGVFGGIEVPSLGPLRPRAFTTEDGTRYAVVPLGGGELALLVARTEAPPFHRSEVLRLAQLVSAAEAVLGEHVRDLPEPMRPDPAVTTRSGGASS
jgi:ACT domain